MSSAIVGVSSPQQIAENARASGVVLDEKVMEAIEEVLGPVAEKDPGKMPSHPTDYSDDRPG